MKRTIFLLLITILLIPYFPKTSFAESNCTGIKQGQKIFWDGVELKPGQIGKLTILKDTTLYNLVAGKMVESKQLKKGSIYRIYSFKSEYLGVGGGYYVKRDAKVSYVTPSKAKLMAVKCAASPSSNQGGTPVTPAKPAPLPNPQPQQPQPQMENLGSQVFNISPIASRAGMDSYGNAYLYITTQGAPSSLVIVDVNTNTVKNHFDLVNSTSAWALDIDRDGILWIGGTTNGNIYSYNPNTDVLKDYGNILDGKDTSIQDLVVSDQYVYASTAYGANIIAFNKRTGKKEFVLPTGNGKIAKSITLDAANQKLYASSGPTAQLFRWDLSTKARTSFITDAYKGDSYAEKLKMIEGYLAVKFYPSKKAALYNFTTGTFMSEFTADSRGFSPLDARTNEFYFTNQGVFYAYNIKNHSIRNTNAEIPKDKSALSLDFVQLKIDPAQSVLTGILDNSGNYYIYNPVTNQVTIRTIAIPPQSVALHLLFSDPALKYVFANGYMTGGLTQYDPKTQTSIQLDGVSQLESALVGDDGKIYAGAYPNARLIELTPQEPWNQTSIKTLLSLHQFGQERITALARNGNHLFAGTYPQTSTKGGLILDYDLTTGAYRLFEDYVKDQSIITLLNTDGYMYGGSSVHANYKISNTKAQFFRFSPDRPNAPYYITLPVQASMVMSLIKGPDGNIWGAADGTIFSYNPKTNSFRTVKIVTGISGLFSNATLLVGMDGNIYGTVEGRLFKVNPVDMSCTILLGSGAYRLTQDMDGNLYYKNGSVLYKLPIKLTPDPSKDQPA